MSLRKEYTEETGRTSIWEIVDIPDSKIISQVIRHLDDYVKWLEFDHYYKMQEKIEQERQAKEELLEALKHSNISMISKRQVAINEQLIDKHTEKDKEKYSD